jgi:transcription antitermination factor NusG
MLHWYALRVRSNAEHLVTAALAVQQIEHYLPCRQVELRTGRKISRPYFPGYVFSHFEFAERRPIIRIPQVIDVLGFGSPAAIPDEQIDAVRRMVEAKVNAAPTDCYHLGDHVVVRSGPLQGIEGYVVHIKNATRLVVNLPLLNRAVSAEVDAASLELLLSSAA